MSVVLDKCQETNDIRGAKTVMMLSQVPASTYFSFDTRKPSASHIYVPKTFYRETQADLDASASRQGREYLKTALLTHPLWRTVSFWDEACW